ncbi:EF-P beta-lysylation protein EpmB [Pleionea sediminis]|uniref:EF-P beta-lysylation protein EpmB n=1 Tax=Pleionea sediminis TaxID=2569479 RepID=UPI0011871300|nr:EF-P beta-lysylation protein EpmB [Pleionea sediminis]
MKGAIIPCSPPVCHKQDWKKQLATAITDPGALLELLKINKEQMGKGNAQSLFSLKVPYAYITRMKQGDPNDPLFLQVWPHDAEFVTSPDFIADPLEEKSSNPIPGLLHKYKSRVLTITTASCAINCRYCFRRHFDYQNQSYNDTAWNSWADYIKQHPEIDEVILSGGEPLLLPDDKLARLLQQLELLPQLKRLRIHSRLPLVIPDRITEEFTALAKSSRLQWVLVWHINHPAEIDDAVQDAAKLCHDAGIVQFNQSVLLKKVNDSIEVMQKLSERLFTNRIQPYYLHLLDRVAGVQHFEVTENKALKLYNQMLVELPGYLVPKLVREEPAKSSKTPINISEAPI